MSFVVFACLLLLSGLSCITHDSAPMAGHAWPKTEPESRSFVTPECPLITECLQGILGDPPYEPSRDGFDRVRNWVAHNVEYQTDQERAGEDDDWQMPQDTLLNTRVGDCEDFSLLLRSLLRGYGIGAERVFVAFGVDRRGNAHAFIIEHWYLDGEWRVIEPQDSAQARQGFFWSRSVDSRLERYEVVLAFNDVYHYEGPFPWDDYEPNPLTLSDIFGAAGNAARRVSELAGYLLGFFSNQDTESA